MPRITSTATATAVGQAMLAARTRLGLTQAEAAKKAGFDSNVWARYERGEREPSLSRIQKIESALRTKLTIGHQPLDAEEPETTLSDEGRRILLTTARRLQALAQEMQDEALATTPMHVPASVVGVRAALRDANRGKRTG